MRRAGKMLRVYAAAAVVLIGAQSALAQFGGPFEFSFATGLLNSIIFAPLGLLGCF
jgi:hypothetical protein